MTTHDNAAPPADWACEARPCPVFQIADRMRSDELAVPPNVTLGEN